MLQTIAWKILKGTDYGAGIKWCSQSCNFRDVITRVAAPPPNLTSQVIWAVHEQRELFLREIYIKLIMQCSWWSTCRPTSRTSDLLQQQVCSWRRKRVRRMMYSSDILHNLRSTCDREAKLEELVHMCPMFCRKDSRRLKRDCTSTLCTCTPEKFNKPVDIQTYMFAHRDYAVVP